MVIFIAKIELTHSIIDKGAISALSSNPPFHSIDLATNMQQGQRYWPLKLIGRFYCTLYLPGMFSKHSVGDVNEFCHITARLREAAMERLVIFLSGIFYSSHKPFIAFA